MKDKEFMNQKANEMSVKDLAEAMLIKLIEGKSATKEMLKEIQEEDWNFVEALKKMNIYAPTCYGILQLFKKHNQKVKEDILLLIAPIDFKPEFIISNEVKKAIDKRAGKL